MTEKKPEKQPLLNIAPGDAQLQKIESLQPIISPVITPAGPPASSQCCGNTPNAQTTSCNCTPVPAAPPCCGPSVLPKPKYRKVTTDFQDDIPRVTSTWSTGDRIGALRARLGKYRMNYAITPGLYALGQPGRTSDILVTANYKLSFDQLRCNLKGMNVWILVLDTFGINVWCAAGKGTFGTEELIHQINDTHLSTRVDTKKLILPQLGAPGVAAHEIKKRTGFDVIWGPVEATDIPKFISAGYKASAPMRRKQFPFRERAVLLPIELWPALKQMLPIVLIGGLLAGITWSGRYLAGVVHYMVLLAIFLIGGIVAGAVLTPLLLPVLPGRAFSAKSILPAAGISAILYAILRTQIVTAELIAFSFMLAGVASYAAMNFTGASTYTSLSGVKKEMKFAVPAQIGAVTTGVLLWITTQLFL